MLTENQFNAIAETCDRLLTGENSSLGRVAISWLHVLSEHPLSAARYEDLERRPSRFRELLRLGRIASRTVGGAGAFDDDLAKLATADVLIISHLVNERQVQSGDDFYFGDLQRVLEERGLTSVLAMRNHLSLPERELRSRVFRSGPRARLLLPKTSSLRDEWRCLRRMMRDRRELARVARYATDALEGSVARQASFRAVTAVSLENLRLHGQIEKLCRRARPRLVLATYEGHAWERCVWHAARAADPGVRCAGYQHTVLWKNSHAAKRRLGSPFDPDLILTVGEVTRDILRETPGFDSVDLVVLGSHRRAGTDAGAAEPGRERRCLVLPEGIESECLTLFRFAIECARRTPDMTFLFRLHPLMSFAALQKIDPALRHLPPNVELSDRPSMSDDFHRSAYCLYRGSSTVLYAMLAGLKPIYFARSGEMRFDPLYSLDTWRQVVSSPEEFQTAAVARDTDGAERNVARMFCDRYVMPLQEAAFNHIAAVARLNRAADVSSQQPSAKPVSER